MPGKIKKITAVVLVLAIAGAVAGYYLWNKPHEDVEGATAIQTEAVALYKTFTEDSIAARAKYIQQVVQVSGIVSSISKNQQGQAVVLIKTGTEGAYINCSLEENAGTIKESAPITIKGICNGIGQGDADLGIPGDIYLVSCVIEK